MGPFSSSSTGDLVPVQCLSGFVGYWQSLSGDSYIKLLLTSDCWHPYYGLVTVYGVDPQVGQPLDGLSFNLCPQILSMYLLPCCWVLPSKGPKYPYIGLHSGYSIGLWIVFWVLRASGLISIYQWVHTMCILLWLGYLTQNIFQFHAFV